MPRPYLCLAFLFALALISQGTFTFDVIRELSGDYSMPPVSFEEPGSIVVDQTPAAQKAGLRKGDRVVAIEGRRFRNARDILQPLHRKKPGQTLAITAEREGEIAERHVMLEPVRVWW